MTDAPFRSLVAHSPGDSHATGRTSKCFKKQKRPPFSSKKSKSPPQAMSDYVYHEFPEAVHNPTFMGRKKPVIGNWASIIGPPYRSWSQYLTRTFDSLLYNQFRRLALDDLFTRHVDYGFNALLGYYRACLLSRCVLFDEVLQDMVSLTRGGPHLEYHDTVHQMLSSTLSSGLMTPERHAKVCQFFETPYTTTALEKSSS